ncbi:MAG: ROK family protein [Dehalococcoidales bacterium]|nr:ROK family protein [Dehalococcoidales bacterium]
MKPPVLSFDLGGTKILAALVLNSRVEFRDYSLTHAEEGPQAVIEYIFKAIDRVLKESGLDITQLHSISIASAGAINTKNGIVTLSPNLPGWQNIPLAEKIQKKYPVSVFLLNDANAAAIAEHRYGAGRGTRHMIYITVSTGIGGGIIINNKIYEGASGGAGEIGHMSLDAKGPKCNCGNTGCMETLASGTALAKEAKRRIKGGEESLLSGMVKGKIEKITGKEIGEAAEKGDVVAIASINRIAGYLGVGLVSLVNIFNPEMIVIGGSVAKLGERLLSPARQIVRERAYPLHASAVKIVPAQLGDDAGIIGAAVYAMQQKPFKPPTAL